MPPQAPRGRRPPRCRRTPPAPRTAAGNTSTAVALTVRGGIPVHIQYISIYIHPGQDIQTHASLGAHMINTDRTHKDMTGTQASCRLILMEAESRLHHG